MPHSVRDEDDDPADHTSRPSSPVGPAPTASADFANSANTASSTAQPTTTITFERLPIPPGGRNVPGESLLTALFRSAPNQGRMPTPAAPRFLPAAPRSLPPALRPIRAGRRSRAAAHCSHQGASRPPAAAFPGHRPTTINPITTSLMDIPGAWHREVLYDLGRPARVTRTPQELERQRDQSVAFTAEEIAEEFERLWQEHLARIERGEESEDELAG